MKLVVDASTLVAEALRERGKVLLQRRDLELFATVRVRSETMHELRRRAALLVERGVQDSEHATDVLAATETILTSRIDFLPLALYAERLAEAIWRIPRDQEDAPTVALALRLDRGIWTNDHDFFGCGLPVWSTDVLRSYLAIQDQSARPSAGADG